MNFFEIAKTPVFYGEKVLCEHCGWPIRFYKGGTERLLCNNCHRWIYKDKQTKLKYENKEQMNKLKKKLL